MLIKTMFAILALITLLFGWVAVQALARRFAARHPECGPYHEAGGGCGGCGAAASCAHQKTIPDSLHRKNPP